MTVKVTKTFCMESQSAYSFLSVS